MLDRLLHSMLHFNSKKLWNIVQNSQLSSSFHWLSANRLLSLQHITYTKTNIGIIAILHIHNRAAKQKTNHWKVRSNSSCWQNMNMCQRLSPMTEGFYRDLKTLHLALCCAVLAE